MNRKARRALQAQRRAKQAQEERLWREQHGPTSKTSPERSLRRRKSRLRSEVARSNAERRKAAETASKSVWQETLEASDIHAVDTLDDDTGIPATPLVKLVYEAVMELPDTYKAIFDRCLIHLCGDPGAANEHNLWQAYEVARRYHLASLVRGDMSDREEQHLLDELRLSTEGELGAIDAVCDALQTLGA